MWGAGLEHGLVAVWRLADAAFWSVGVKRNGYDCHRRRDFSAASRGQVVGVVARAGRSCSFRASSRAGFARLFDPGCPSRSSLSVRLPHCKVVPVCPILPPGTEERADRAASLDAP